MEGTETKRNAPLKIRSRKRTVTEGDSSGAKKYRGAWGNNIAHHRRGKTAAVKKGEGWNSGEKEVGIERPKRVKKKIRIGGKRGERD